jgi:hypothetical protein
MIVLFYSPAAPPARGGRAEEAVPLAGVLVVVIGILILILIYSLTHILYITPYSWDLSPDQA